MDNEPRNHEYAYCEGDGYLQPNSYLHPCSPDTYSPVQNGNRAEHGYTALELDTPSNCTRTASTNTEQASKRLSRVLKRQSSVCAIVAWTFLGIVFGSLVTGLSVFFFTEASCERRLAEQNQSRSIVHHEYSMATTTQMKVAVIPQRSPTDITTSFLRTPSPGGSTLDGQTVNILCKADRKLWHYDASGSKFVSAIYQTNDNNIKFKLERQTDGSYKIKSAGGDVYIFDGYMTYGSALDVLNGYYHSDDDHARFLVTLEKAGHYRIQTKATRRFVRLDESLKVSSKLNIKDDRSLFILLISG